MIRVAIVENEHDFAERVKRFFEENYQEDFHISTFDTTEVLKYIGDEVDIAVISEKYVDVEVGMNDHYVLITKLTEDTVQSVNNGIPTIPKYQKAENMHMQFIELYALREKKKTEREIALMPPKLVTFLSTITDAGTTTQTHAFALRANEQGKKALIVDVRSMSNSESEFGISDDYTLETYLESGLVGSTIYGVDYLHVKKKFSEDYNTTIVENIKKILDMNIYKYIIMDMEFDYSIFTKEILTLSTNIALTVPCTDVGVNAINTYESILKDENSNDMAEVVLKSGIIYNKITNESEKYAETTELATYGGVPFIDVVSNKEVVNELSKMKFLDNIL